MHTRFDTPSTVGVPAPLADGASSYALAPDRGARLWTTTAEWSGAA